MAENSQDTQSKSRTSKRLSPAQVLWNELIGPQTRTCIPANKLPTNRVIMQRYSTMKSAHTRSTPVVFFASQLYDEVVDVWEKANIPVKNKKAATQSLTRLLQSWTTFSSDAHKCKPESEKYQKYKSMLGELFDIADGNEDQLKDLMRSSKLPTWERDYQFYLNQKAGVVDIMDGIDYQSVKRQKLSTARKEDEENRKQKEILRRSKRTEVSSKEIVQESSESSEEDLVTDADTTVSYWHKYTMNKKPDTVTLTMPRKGLAKLLAPSAARMHMSTSQSFAYASEVIKAGSGMISDFAISRSTFYAQRKDAEQELAEKLMEKFKSDTRDCYFIIHWDGKKVKLMNGEIEERIAILLQSVLSGLPPQFIGAPRVPDGTGRSMKDAMMIYLEMYGLSEAAKHKIIGIEFDTTASNTGHINGAGALLENELDHALLWFACRHHISELHIGWADDAVRHAIGKNFINFCYETVYYSH